VSGVRRGIAITAIALLAVGLAAGPAPGRAWQEEDFGQVPPKLYTFLPPGGVPIDSVVTVVGQTRRYEPEKGDTFLDLARYFDLGFNEIADANPNSDEWIPATVGEPLTIPQEFVLPCCTYSGIVVNIPEMRLYYYPKKGAGARTVQSFPVGLGREDWRTPVGKFTIRSKDLNPTWVIPESIRKERVADRGYSETMIPGGDPKNPLGKHRMRLSLNLYGIHGTNIPWGVGMLVSHGCVRLYPEDIERLFPKVAVGTPGEFVYQTVKVGMRSGRVYVEVHKDLYGIQPGPWRQATKLLEQQGLLERVDEGKLEAAVEAQSGVPIDVSRDDYVPTAPVDAPKIAPSSADPAGSKKKLAPRVQPARSKNPAGTTPPSRPSRQLVER
jgi:L,D-transpeptidase ErfK/SrfK